MSKMEAKTKLGLAVVLIALGATGALAAGFYTAGMPPAGGSQYPSTVPLTGAEAFGADTKLTNGQNPASEAITTGQLAAYVGSQPDPSNFLIGGDATTNLFQRGTTGASETTTVAYGGPDRWAYWSGASTAVTVSKDTTVAASLPGYGASFKFARTSGQTGVVQACMAQEVSSQWAQALQSQTAELDFHAYGGANFSAASQNITGYIIYGTGTDEGMTKLAYGLNAGGGGSVGWTGQTNATAGVVSLGGTGAWGRYSMVGTIPSTATEVGVAICWTPVGTAGTTDALYVTGVQLRRNPQLASYVNASVGYLSSTIQASSFQRRPPALEQELQQYFYYQITEGTPVGAVAVGKAVSTTVANFFVQFPTTMRAIPTVTYTAGFATETTVGGGTLGACTGLATASTVTGTAASTSGVLVGCTATTVPAAGSAAVLFTNGGSGAIKASAEL